MLTPISQFIIIILSLCVESIVMETASSARVRWATANDDVSFLTHEIINPAYLVGERGIIQEPFQRTNEAEVKEWIDNQELLIVAISDDDSLEKDDDDQTVNNNESDAILGCVRVESKPTKVKWGCLAVHPEHQGKGYGRELVHAIEKYAIREGKQQIELELLIPRYWYHEHKERLRTWYTKSLGYVLANPDQAKDEASLFTKGRVLMEGIVLETDSDFLIYEKSLVPASRMSNEL